MYKRQDYIRYVLTGVFATDVSDATGMQLLDVKNRCWSEEILDALKIDKNLLGKVYESQEVTGTLLPEIAEQCEMCIRDRCRSIPATSTPLRT